MEANADMILSMTGFGQAAGRILDRDVTVEMRSVNNRFRDVIVRMPKSFQALDDQIKKIVAGKVARGRVDASIQIDDANNRNERLLLDMELARAYYGMLKQLKDEFDLSGDITVDNMTNLRDVIRYEEEELDLEEFMAGLKELIDEALGKLVNMRKTEGRAIAADFRNRLADMAGWVDGIEAKRDVVVSETRAKLEHRIAALTDGVELDQTRLHQEAAYIIDRSDITEEIVRLRSHFSQFDAVLNKVGPVGRKLEFLLQEINREVNTIGSKSGDVEISNLVVDLKSELEKLREQVMNVE